MKKALSIAVLMLVGVTVSWGATARHPATRRPDLFETFRQLDGQFTQLDTEFKGLQESVARGGNSRRVWRQHSLEVRRTTAKIQAVSYRMSAHYRQSGAKFGYKSFAKLSHDAGRLRLEMAR